MKTIIIAAGGWLLGIVILANVALALRPQPVRAAAVPPSSDARIVALEQQVARQQEFIDDHTTDYERWGFIKSINGQRQF